MCINGVTGNRVLAIGVYLIDQPNYALQITEELIRTRDWELDLRWVGIGEGNPPMELMGYTVMVVKRMLPKFVLLNRVLQTVSLETYRFLLVTDDDIELPDRFLDTYLWIQMRVGFSLAQPARSRDSFIDHEFVAQLPGIAARWTRFVEIGPFFSIDESAFTNILPFNEESPMGWGLDFVWPLQIEGSGKRLGIIDALPVRHALRRPVSLYKYQKTEKEMVEFLAHYEHLSEHDAFVTIQSYPVSNALVTPNHGCCL